MAPDTAHTPQLGLALSDLPIELLLLIVKHALKRDALALAATNHHYYDLINNHIYSDFIRHDADGGLPLRWASKAGSSFALATARRVLALGASVSVCHRHCPGSSKDTHLPLQLAVNGEHVAMVELLLSYCADPWPSCTIGRASALATNEGDGNGLDHGIVALAAGRGNCAIMRLLLTASHKCKDHDAENGDPIVCPKHMTDSHGTNGLRPLHTAAAAGRGAVVRLLLDCGADVHIRDRWGITSLHRALTNAAPDVVAILLDAGADPLAEDSTSESCLDRAIMMLHEQWNLAALDAEDAEECAGRVLANLEQVLRRAKAVWNPAEKRHQPGLWFGKTEHETHVFLTRARRTSAAVKLLIEVGDIPVDARCDEQEGAFTALRWFSGQSDFANCEFAAVEILDMLLDAGADINAQDAIRGLTPVMRAAEARLKDVMVLLLSRGARVDLRDTTGQGVLSHGGSAVVLQTLLDHGRQQDGKLSPEMAQQLELRDELGRTQLIRALWGGPVANVEVLIYAGADVLACTDEGIDAIGLAASWDETAHLVPLLVQRGALVNSPDCPPLLKGVDNESLAGVKALLECGAHPDANLTYLPTCPSEESRPPLVRAVQSSNTDITRVLLEYGASVRFAFLSEPDLLGSCRKNRDKAMIELLYEFGAGQWDSGARSNTYRRPSAFEQ
ncbi:serine/threonine-protein phosphatase 6 regulatory ankyrin repeat subunit A [Microdochium nivale]|nr:serine/threonine-protein phosphatase 6 regulatory ankyrin repeat subunit A [Microdochium nivale]